MKKLFLIVFSLFTFTISAQESVLDSIALTEVTVTSQVVDVARDRITPIAFSSVSGAEIDLKAGNLEFVETLKRTPGVYTNQDNLEVVFHNMLDDATVQHLLMRS